MRSTTYQAVNAVSFKPLRWLLSQVLGAADIILDELYDHMDLWADRDNHIADYGKVRGALVLYGVVCPIMYIVVLQSKSLPTAFLGTMLMALLAYSLGDRMFSKFLAIWAKKQGVTEGTIQMSPKDQLAQIAPEVRPPTDSDNNS
jgi:hypothetical protein